MKVEIIPQLDIITISRVVRLIAEASDNLDAVDDLDVKPGIYALDSQGSVWRKDMNASSLLAAFDYQDTQLQRERVEVRRRNQKSKVKPQRVQ